MNIRSISAFSLAAALSVSALSPLSAAVQNAKPISEVAPTYARDLCKDGTEGEVVVGFTITAQGDVVNPMVISTTARALDNAALAAVRKWKFAPAMEGSVPVSQQAILPFAFTIPALHSDADARILVSNSRPVSQPKNTTSAN